MPLSAAGLGSQLGSSFSSPATSAAGCAGQWATAVQAYASSIVPPSAAVNVAAEALESGLVTAFSSSDAIPGMEQAFAAFVLALAGGMAPAYTGVPPAGPVGFASLFGGAPPETHTEAGSKVANVIDAWMKTGSATLVAPPNTVQPWA